jgi:hypothetical protein
MRHMQAAMVHGGGGGVLLMMMTELASKQTIKKHKITNKCNQILLTHNHIQLKTKKKKKKQKTTMATDTLFHQTNLPQRSSSFK